MSVLDLSKLLMSDFYYYHIKAQHKERCNLLYTDVDSLFMEIQAEDVYRDIQKYITNYDTSDYPKNHQIRHEQYKTVLFQGEKQETWNGRPPIYRPPYLQTTSE